MTPQRFSAVGFTLLALAAVATAGPIEFSLRTDNIVISEADKPGLNLILRPYQPSDSVFTYTPGRNTPTRLPAVVQYDPTSLPSPGSRDLHWADGVGYTHVNIEGKFGVDVHLRDAASGEEGTVRLFGRAHTNNWYTTTTDGWVEPGESGWPVSSAWFWLVGSGQIKLGENTYTVRTMNDLNAGMGIVNVWVNDTPPVETPEPGTMILAAIGLAGVTGAGWLRRRKRPVASAPSA